MWQWGNDNPHVFVFIVVALLSRKTTSVQSITEYGHPQRQTVRGTWTTEWCDNDNANANGIVNGIRHAIMGNVQFLISEVDDFILFPKFVFQLKFVTPVY